MAGTPTEGEGVVGAARNANARKGAVPAGQGLIPYQPTQCQSYKVSGDRCTAKPVSGKKHCFGHSRNNA